MVHSELLIFAENAGTASLLLELLPLAEAGGGRGVWLLGLPAQWQVVQVLAAHLLFLALVGVEGLRVRLTRGLFAGGGRS